MTCYLLYRLVLSNSIPVCDSMMPCNGRDHNTMSHNTRDHSTRYHRTRDHNNRCVSSTSNCHQSNCPRILYPKGYRQQYCNRDVRDDGNGTGGGSGRNHQRRRCNPRRMTNGPPSHTHQIHKWCHVCKLWVHHPVSIRPHTVSDLFRMYIGGYTHRDHGLLLSWE